MDFVPQRKGSFVSGSKGLCQVSSKSEQNCDRESADRQTDKHTDRDDTSDLIICPMLCYSNGTDNNNKTVNHITVRSEHIINTTLLPQSFINIRWNSLIRKDIISTCKGAIMYKVLNKSRDSITTIEITVKIPCDNTFTVSEPITPIAELDIAGLGNDKSDNAGLGN